jgi:carbamoyltransferase
MESAMVYSGMDGYTIVADGFGNYNECISVYRDKQLIHRVHGYDHSLGLLYQYATAFLGMKMNQDEYKLLGYEAHIDEIGAGAYNELASAISRFAKRHVQSSLTKMITPKYDAVCNVSALPELRAKLERDFKQVVRAMDAHEHMDEFKTRVAIAHLVQSVVEQSIVALVNKYGMTKVTLTGGLFYNVKLNNRVMKEVEMICVFPLAGDQAGGLGVYQHNFKDLVISDLCLGNRPPLSSFASWRHDKLKYRQYGPDVMLEIIQDVKDNKIVNVVHGNMEFGPRALGNTTTLMLPSLELVDYVNKINGRSTIMPMAPICTNLDYFEDHQKVHRSYEHMIITLDYKDDAWKKVRGAAHKYPFEERYSGRPQLISNNHWLYPVVSEFGLLINTSFNVHGAPIVFGPNEIAESFFYQIERDSENRVVTYIVE